MTGIEGFYNFNIEFAPEISFAPPTGAGDADRALARTEAALSVFDAVKQYGLRLEARKAPIEMITVIHLDKMPTDN